MSIPYLHIWCGLSANLECRSETCCARRSEKYRTQKIAKKSPSGHHPTTLSSYIFANKACIDSRRNLLSSNISTCPHNMVNFGPLAAEIVSLVWGTPANFNGFRLLAALLHGTLVVGVRNFRHIRHKKTIGLHLEMSTFITMKKKKLELCANAQRDGRPAEYRWRRLFNAAKFG